MTGAIMRYLKCFVFFALFIFLSSCSHSATNVKTSRNSLAASISMSGVAFKVAEVPFTTAVTPDAVVAAIARINAVQNNHDIILMEINSPGGAVWSGVELSKVIERSRIPVVCVVDGMAASMGYYLLQSCHVRVMSKRSILMIHEPSITSFGGNNPGQLQDLTKRLRALSRAMVEHMALRLLISADELEERIRRTDYWLDWQEAVEIGAVDFTVDRYSDVRSALN
jgi:ATP-dependent protease ClpP protease subunit